MQLVAKPGDWDRSAEPILLKLAESAAEGRAQRHRCYKSLLQTQLAALQERERENSHKEDKDEDEDA